MDKGEERLKNGQKKWKLTDSIVLILALAVLGISVYKIAGIFLEYKAGTDEYQAMEAYAEEKKPDKSPEAGSGLNAEEWEIPKLQVDFAALTEKNGDFIGWLYFPALEISYPIVQGKDNEYYLNHTFEKRENSCGAIFMDSDAAADFTDYNTFLYGHNMRNGSMFGKLKKLSAEETICQENPYFYIYTPEKTLAYRIISYYATTDGSDTYFAPGSRESYEDYLKMILRNSLLKSDYAAEDGNGLITLSTCYGAAGSDRRFVVHGVLTETKAQEG